jgi:DUF971 family protein
VTRPHVWPTDLDFNRAAAELRIRFDDGFAGVIPFELLRVESPSAETKGHGADRPPPPAGKRSVWVTGAEPVGRYAVRIVFSDGHESGLYTWSLLRELAEGSDVRLDAYLQRLAEAGRSRD